VLNTNNFTVERNKGSDLFDNLKTREPGFRGDGADLKPNLLLKAKNAEYGSKSESVLVTKQDLYISSQCLYM